MRARLSVQVLCVCFYASFDTTSVRAGSLAGGSTGTDTGWNGTLIRGSATAVGATRAAPSPVRAAAARRVDFFIPTTLGKLAAD